MALSGNGSEGASAAYSSRRQHLLSETGEMLVFRAGRKPEVLARSDVGEQRIASPAFSNRQIFIRTDRNLIAVGRP